ncbi:MAG: hypothetical protein KDB80_12925 [Planctomycetes bacterium]|nr:hypothetical protein [Planctomycetota bacterium]
MKSKLAILFLLACGLSLFGCTTDSKPATPSEEDHGHSHADGEHSHDDSANESSGK